MATNTERFPVQQPVVYVCTGSDCRKGKKAYKKLTDELSARAVVCEVKCQKICSGPVVGVAVEGRLEWFRKLCKSSIHKELYRLLRSGRMSSALKGHVVKARRGKLRIKKKLKKAA